MFIIVGITVEIAWDVRNIHRKNRGDAPVFGSNQMETVDMFKEAVVILLETVEMPLVLKKQFQNFREKQKRHPCE